MRIRRDALILLAAPLLLLPRSTAAVTQIESYVWDPPGSNPCISMGFTARVTSTDLAAGLRFSLQERNVGSNEMLADFALPWASPYPPAGTEIRIFVDMCLVCRGAGLSGGNIAQWTATWCEPPAPTQLRGGQNTAPLTIGSADAEVHELVLVDENGIEGSNPSPEDFLSCSGPPGMNGASLLDLPSPFGLVAAGKSIAEASPWDRLGISRIDPDIDADPTGSIGLYFDAAGEIACGEVPPGSSATLYIVAKTAGPTECGITGAELRVANMPAAWFSNAISPPGSLQFGNPLDSTGANMAFHTCQAGAPGFVLLYTVSIFATTPVTNHLVEIRARNPSLNPFFRCPLVTLCDAPIYTIVCVEGMGALLNPPPGDACNLPIGVELHTWSRVKRLYE
jgi:hypothetical protein